MLRLCNLFRSWGYQGRLFPLDVRKVCIQSGRSASGVWPAARYCRRIAAVGLRVMDIGWGCHAVVAMVAFRLQCFAAKVMLLVLFSTRTVPPKWQGLVTTSDQTYRLSKWSFRATGPVAVKVEDEGQGWSINLVIREEYQRIMGWLKGPGASNITLSKVRLKCTTVRTSFLQPPRSILMGKYGKIKIYKYLYLYQNIYQLRTILPKKKRIGVVKTQPLHWLQIGFMFKLKPQNGMLNYI